MEGQLNIEVDDYAYEDAWMQQKFGKNIELRVHLYIIQGYNHGWGTILRTMNKLGPHEEIKFHVQQETKYQTLFFNMKKNLHVSNEDEFWQVLDMVG